MCSLVMSYCSCDITGPEEAISHWSGKIQAAGKVLNGGLGAKLPHRNMDALRLNLVQFFSSQLATLNIHYYLTLCHILK